MSGLKILGLPHGVNALAPKVRDMDKPSSRLKSVNSTLPEGVAAVATIEVGHAGIALLLANQLLDQQDLSDRKKISQATEAALALWASGNGARIAAQ